MASLTDAVNEWILTVAGEQSVFNVEYINPLNLTSHDDDMYEVSKDELTQQFVMGIKVDATIFDESFRERIKGYVANIISHMENKVHEQITLSGLMGREEQTQLLGNINKNVHPYPEGKCIHELFEEQVATNPRATALVCGERQLSYDELNRRANRLAHYLVDQGVGPEALVGICVNRGIDMVVSILGILKSGAAYVPIDTSYPPFRVQYMLDDSGVDILLTEVNLAAQFSTIHQELLLVNSEDFDILLSKHSTDNICTQSLGLGPENLSYLIYTSGSTGQPKGVMGLHRSIVNRVNWLKRSVGVKADDVLCQKTSLGFVDHVAEIFQALSAGVPLVIVATQLLQSPSLLMETLNQQKITHITLVPSLLKLLLESEDAGEAPYLKAIFSSGEALNLPDMVSFSRRFPHSRLFNIYGSTEIGADVTAYEFDRQKGTSVEANRSLI